MSDSILVSNANIEPILQALITDLKTKISNKDISLPYTTEFTKGTYLKINGDGTMFLSNNGSYIKIGTIVQDQLDISKINQIFNIVNNPSKWDNTGILSKPTSTSDFGCVQYNGKIYCIGGNAGSGGGASNILEIYNIANNTWSTGTNIPVNNSSFGCVQYNGKIYCIGGNVNSLYIYDINSNTWSTGTNMPVNNSSFGCVQYNGKIYCIGGPNNINSIYIYDINSNTWSTGANLPIKNYSFGCAQYNGKIYCIGGGTMINTVYIYDINSNTWSTGTSMPIVCGYFGYTDYNGAIYCIGGMSNGNTLNTVYIYNIINNTWSTGNNMPIINREFGCVQYNGKIYCIGGGISTSPYRLNTVNILQLPYASYNTPLPSSLSTKLNKLITTGTGNKIFSNDGTYKSITPSYTVMGSTDISDMLTRLNS